MWGSVINDRLLQFWSPLKHSMACVKIIEAISFLKGNTEVICRRGVQIHAKGHRNVIFWRGMRRRAGMAAIATGSDDVELIRTPSENPP